MQRTQAGSRGLACRAGPAARVGSQPCLRDHRAGRILSWHLGGEWGCGAHWWGGGDEVLGGAGLCTGQGRPGLHWAQAWVCWEVLAGSACFSSGCLWGLGARLSSELG